MEDKTIKKLNIEPANLPEVPRTIEGKIDLEAITIEIDEKNNKIIPDDIFDSYYRELPNGVINNSKTWRTSNGGKIKIFGGDPEADKAIHQKGAATSNAAQAQRRTFKDTIEYMLRQKAKREAIEDLELKEDATNLDMIIASALRQAARGNTKAYEFLRDTAGEKPTEKIAAEVETITPEDRQRIERILNRDKITE
jgi:hypothetical protein